MPPHDPTDMPSHDPTAHPTALEELLQYRFRDPRWLQQALTHRSFCHEARKEPVPSYERLEFLGDAVLELAISHSLWLHYPSLPEGGLTAFRASLVKRETLATIAQQHGLGRFVRLGRGEQQRGGETRESILADTMEALLGAVFVDGGFAQAQRVCSLLFADTFGKLDPTKLTNYKNQLQEFAASEQLPAPQYNFLRMDGPEHTPTFFMEAIIEPYHRVTGQGNTKKDASQHAAQLLLAQLKQERALRAPTATPTQTTQPQPTRPPKPQHTHPPKQPTRPQNHTPPKPSTNKPFPKKRRSSKNK